MINHGCVRVRGVPFRRVARWAAMFIALLVIATSCVCAARVRTLSPDPQVSAASGSGPAAAAAIGAAAIDTDVRPTASGAAAAAVGAAVGPVVTSPTAGRDLRIGDPVVAYILAGGLVLAVLAYPVGRLIWRRGDGSWRGRSSRGSLLRPPPVRRVPPASNVHDH
mgnify:CR=1 FL=1